MASIYKRKDGKGWRAVIRIKNHPTVCDHFDRKEEAEDWAKETELKIKLGKYSFFNKAKEYGQGFTLSSLSRMLKFAELFPDAQIVATLSQQLSWSHFVEILPLKEPLKRDFYAEMCRIEKWNVRTLRKKNRFHALRKNSIIQKT